MEANMKALVESEMRTWRENLKAILTEQTQQLESGLMSQLDTLAKRIETLENIPRGAPAHRYPGLKSYNPTGMGNEIGPEDRVRIVQHLTELAEKSSSGPAVKAFLAEQRAPYHSGPVRISQSVGPVTIPLGEMSAPQNAKIRVFRDNRQVL